MSELPIAASDARKALKEQLEIEQLQVQLARDKRDEEETDNLTRKKLRLEIRDIRKRWPWQLAQYVVIIAGVMVSAISLSLSYFTYRKAVREERQKGLQVASEHLQNGWPSGAVELVQYVPEGLDILVKSVDATNATVQKSWPVVTIAAIDELQRYGKLTERQQADLVRAMNSNHARLLELIVEARNTSKKKSPEYAVLLKSINDFSCVQIGLQGVLGSAPPAWEKTRVDANGALGGDPKC